MKASHKPRWIETQVSILTSVIEAIETDPVLAGRIVEEDVPVVATYLMLNQQVHMLHKSVEKSGL